MKYKIGQVVQYYADDTQEFYAGKVVDVSENFIKPEFTQYQVCFIGGKFWLYECDLLEWVQ
tara:strand:- start:26 stop:208 length:183 start_codon:yes stop_codon:yes gene_type:complete